MSSTDFFAMRSCHFLRLELAACVTAAWVILASWPAWGVAQDNPLRLEAVPESRVVQQEQEKQERQLAERIASMCSQQFGPWMQWFTLVSQMPDKSAEVVADEEANRIIEIPEAAMLAIDPPEVLDEAKDAASEEKGGEALKISDMPAPKAIPEDASLEKESLIPENSGKSSTASKEPADKEVASRETAGRNKRTPRSLVEVDQEQEDRSAKPRALSESMKSKSQEPPAKRSIKSSDEDMRDYLAQEEPSPDSVRNSTNDQMQGVDADRAAKPDTSNLFDEGARPPSKERSIDDKPRTQVSATMQQRLTRVQGCLDHYLKNPETTTARSPWAVMHALLAYGADYELIGPNGRVNAIGWMCHNGLCRTQRIFTPRGDFFVPNVGGGVQGHEGQFLAILAQCQVPMDYPIQIGSKRFTVEDLVRYEMATCKEKSELTFKLIGLSYYVDAQKQWRTKDGKIWNIEKLLREELAQPVVGAACGGAHRLMGLSFCLRQRELQGLPINGDFARAAKFINEYVLYTWQLQNPDGSFSTNWYASRGNEPNDERKVQTSGHMLEWLMFTVSDEELTSPRVEKAVDFLLTRIHDRRDFKWPIGPRGHATRALALYNLRIEALLEHRPGLPADSLAKERVPLVDSEKTTISPTPAPVRSGQVSPATRPSRQPASRSTGRPNQRVRS